MTNDVYAKVMRLQDEDSHPGGLQEHVDQVQSLRQVGAAAPAHALPQQGQHHLQPMLMTHLRGLPSLALALAVRPGCQLPAEQEA